MADGRKLVLTFATDEGKSMTMSFKYMKSNIVTLDVQNLVDTILANKSIFENVPAIAKSAKLVTTTETIYSLSDTNRETPYTVPEAFERGLVGLDDYLEHCLTNEIKPDMALMEKVRKATEEAERKATEDEIHTAELK